MNTTQNQAPKDQAIVLVSGGLDSTVALAETLAQMPVVLALSVDYGQRAFLAEWQAAQALCRHYHLPLQKIELPWLSQLLPKALKRSETADTHKEATEDVFALKRVWVPNRNGILLNIAAAFAEAHGANTIVFGANAEEGIDFPDNTEAYRDALTASLAYSTLNHVQVLTPVSQLDKAQIVGRGLALNVPLEWVWSCYEAPSAHDHKQCGQCASCLRLKRALASAQYALSTIN